MLRLLSAESEIENALYRSYSLALSNDGEMCATVAGTFLEPDRVREVTRIRHFPCNLSMNCSGDIGGYRRTVFENGKNRHRGDRSFRLNSSGHGYLRYCLIRVANDDDYSFPSWFRRIGLFLL